MTALRVIIAGGGVGGLALAQGLKRAGIDVRLLERQVSGGPGGYRLHMNGDGGNALQALLPPELFELYLDTSRTDPRRERLLILDNRLRKLAARGHLGAPTAGRRKDTAVNRKTLRQIMLTGLDGIVEDAEVETYEERPDEVEVVLADGRRLTCDILVGFDGINSRIRSRRLPQAKVMDTGLFGVYGRTPLTPELARSLPQQLFDGFVLVFGPKLLEGGIVALGAFDPRVAVAEAAASRGIGTALDPVEPYMMIGAGIPASILTELGIEPATATKDQIKRALQSLMRGWDRSIVDMVDRAPASDLFATKSRYVDPPDHWTPGRVTLAGDAIHAMPPSLGVGANLALRDAQLLAETLAPIRSADREAIVAAIGTYEARMRDYAFPLLRRAITQEGTASGFTPLGIIRLVRMVGLGNVIRASRARDQISRPIDATELERA